MPGKKESGAEIYVFPWELWEYVKENRDLLAEKMAIVAEDKSSGVEIAVDLEAADDFPTVSVFIGGDLSTEETVVGPEDALITMRRLYDSYIGFDMALTGRSPPPKEADPEEDDAAEESDDGDADELDDEEYMAYSRREEIEEAFMLFLDTLLGEEAGRVTEEHFQNMLDDVLYDVASFDYLVYAPELVGDKWVKYPYND